MDVTVVMTEAATTPGFALDYAFGNKRRTVGSKELPSCQSLLSPFAAGTMVWQVLYACRQKVKVYV